jgi:hypothetical protein
VRRAVAEALQTSCAAVLAVYRQKSGDDEYVTQRFHSSPVERGELAASPFQSGIDFHKPNLLLTARGRPETGGEHERWSSLDDCEVPGAVLAIKLVPRNQFGASSYRLLLLLVVGAQ